MVFFEELVLERQKVFDDAVMHYDDATGAVAVRMRVLFGRPSVCRPASVSDSIGAIERAKPDRLLEVSQLALRAANIEMAFFVHHRYSRRIIAAILELLEPVEDYAQDLFVSHVPNYSAHKSSLISLFEFRVAGFCIVAVQLLLHLCRDSRDQGLSRNVSCDHRAGAGF